VSDGSSGTDEAIAPFTRHSGAEFQEQKAKLLAG